MTVYGFKITQAGGTSYSGLYGKEKCTVRLIITAVTESCRRRKQKIWMYKVKISAQYLYGAAIRGGSARKPKGCLFALAVY